METPTTTSIINRVRYWVVWIFVLLVPLVYLPEYSRNIQEDWFQYFSMSLIAFFIGNIWIGAFLLLNVLLYIYYGAEIGNSQVLNVVFGSIIFMMARFWFKKNSIKDIITPISIISLITIAWMLMQLMSIDLIFMPQSAGGEIMPVAMHDPVGFFGIKEANGTFLTLAMAIISIISPLIAIFLTIPIFISQSSSVILAWFAVVAIYLYHFKGQFFKWFLIGSALIAVGTIVLDLKTDPKTFLSRFGIWHATASYALKNPLGYGPDSYRNTHSKKNFLFTSDVLYNHAVLKKEGDHIDLGFYSPTRDAVEVETNTMKFLSRGAGPKELSFWDNPHNIILQVLFQYGIIGLIIFFGLLREIWLRFRFSTKDKEIVALFSCIVVYLITAMTNFPFEIARTAYLLPLLLGAFFSKTDEQL